MQGYFDQPRFRTLLSASSAHRVTEVRLFVQYDAVMEWDGSSTSPGCVPSRVLGGAWNDAAGRFHPAGESVNALIAGLIEAHADGVTPMVAIAGYASPHAKPAWDPPAPDPTTIGGYWEYRCGVEGILGAVSRLPADEQPHVWEAFNEPNALDVYRSLDGAQATSCAPSPTPQPDGAAKAACDEVDATRVIHDYAGHAGDTVIAGTFIAPSTSYLSAYAAAIGREMARDYPTTWSVHDYYDVDHAYAGATSSLLAPFDRALAADTGGRARSLWITEAGTVLTDHHRFGGCAATGVDAAGTLGACLSGQPARQATTAAAFLRPAVAWQAPSRSPTCSGTSSRARSTGTRGSWTQAARRAPATARFSAAAAATGDPNATSPPPVAAAAAAASSPDPSG